MAKMEWLNGEVKVRRRRLIFLNVAAWDMEMLLAVVEEAMDGKKPVRDANRAMELMRGKLRSMKKNLDEIANLEPCGGQA